MAASKPRFIRNPQTPRTSIMSGRKHDPENGRRMIDLGVDPINRYGFVYIDEHDAMSIAELIGWVPGDDARQIIDDLENRNRTLLAQLEAAPLMVAEITERYTDGLTALARDLTAAYRDRLAAIAANVPAVAGFGAQRLPIRNDGAEQAASEPAGDADEGAAGIAGAAVGGLEVVVGGAADGDAGDSQSAADDAAGDVGDVPGAAAAAAEGAAGGDGDPRAVPHPPVDITDIVVEDPRDAAGDEG